MRKKILLFIFSIIIFSIPLQSQEIKGIIIDEKNNPVEYATVILQTHDSVFVAAVYTDTMGSFRFKSTITPFRLIIQHVLYETKIIESINIDDVKTIMMTTKENILKEVVIKSENMLEVSNGKLIYNVPILIKNKIVNNAYDVMLELPGIWEDNGFLSLIGANSLSVIINGKPSTMSKNQLIELLKNMPSENIEKAEIMYSTPPQYHVKGASINLIIKRNYSDDIYGHASIEYDQKYYDNYKTSFSLLFNNSKIYTDFFGSVNNGKARTGFELTSQHLLDNQIYNLIISNRRKGEFQTYNARIGLDYNIAENSRLSFIYTSQIIPRSDTRDTSTSNYFSNSINKNTYLKPEQMHNIHLDYSKNDRLNIGIDYTYFIDNSNQIYGNLSEIEPINFQAKATQKINRFKIYLDNSKELIKNWSLNYGLEFSYAKDNNSQHYDSKTNDNLDELNVNAKQNEYTCDIYSGFSKSFSSKLSISIDLTGEYYQLNSYKKWTLFPTISSSFVYSPIHIFRLNLSSEKIYPAYWEMNNFVTFLNDYAEIYGNPELQPYQSYSTQLSYILKKMYIFTIYNIYNDNYFVQLPYQSPDQLKLIYQTTNFDYANRIGINILTPFTKGIFSSRLTTNVFFYRTKNLYFHDISFEKNKCILYLQLNNAFTISNKPNIKAEINMFYASKNLQGPGELSSIYKIDMGIKLISSKGKLELNLKGNDLFNSWVPDLTMKYSNQDLFMHTIPDSRMISLSLNYKFGNDRNKEKKRENIDTSRFGK